MASIHLPGAEIKAKLSIGRLKNKQGCFLIYTYQFNKKYPYFFTKIIVFSLKFKNETDEEKKTEDIEEWHIRGKLGYI